MTSINISKLIDKPLTIRRRSGYTLRKIMSSICLFHGGNYIGSIWQLPGDHFEVLRSGKRSMVIRYNSISTK